MEGYLDVYDFLFRNRLYKDRGKYMLKTIAFNIYLQDFALKVHYICDSQSTGQLSEKDSINKIDQLWQELERRYLELGLGSFNSSQEDIKKTQNDCEVIL